MRTFGRRSLLSATTAAVAVALVPGVALAAPSGIAATARDYEMDGPHQFVKAAGAARTPSITPLTSPRAPSNIPC